MELAVSVPPAPRPIMVCVPECSEVNAIAFNVPSTHNGLSFLISTGLTVRLPLHEAINLIELELRPAFLISSVLTSLIPVISQSLIHI